MNEATEVKKSATAIILKKYEEVSITKILGYGSLFFLLAVFLFTVTKKQINI